MEQQLKYLFAGPARLLCGFIIIILGASTFALVPQPAADQSEPIAIVGAIIHIGNGEVIADGVITFSEGIITAVAAADDGVDLSNHLVIDLQGAHVYPGFILPNTSLGLTEVGASRATADFEEEGDINASVRSAIAYNTDSEIISTHRFNGILTAQVTPQGGLVSGSSSLMKLDGWNWEDAALRIDDGIHLYWPGLKTRRRNPDTFRFETVDNEEYAGAVQLLRSLFQNAQTYTGEPLNLNLQAMRPLFNGSAKLFIHADGAKEIISAVRFARSYPIADVVLVGGREALMVK
ncbi:MAG: amidohydrolase, partial [Proteobacteria bacterium]|nr:amidohydrolase [Pseudomonadota bacterium]